MKFRSILSVCILVAGTYVTSAHAQEEQAVKEAVRRIMSATFEGDERALVAAVGSIDAAKLEDIRLQLRESRVYLKLTRMLMKHFGNDARNVWPEDLDAEFAADLKRVNRAKVKIDGERAVVIFGEKQEQKTYRCRKMAGEWKAELPESLEVKGPAVPIPGVPDWKEVTRDAIRRSEETIARLEKGEFKNATEARDAFEGRKQKG